VYSYRLLCFWLQNCLSGNFNFCKNNGSWLTTRKTYVSIVGEKDEILQKRERERETRMPASNIFLAAGKGEARSVKCGAYCREHFYTCKLHFTLVNYILHL
jgi:hypothetical protein